MGPVVAALLPLLSNLLTSKSKDKKPASYDMTPPAPGGTPQDDEIGKSRMVIAQMQMPPKAEKIGDKLADSEPDKDKDDMWNLLGGGGGGY